VSTGSLFQEANIISKKIVTDKKARLSGVCFVFESAAADTPWARIPCAAE